ncbi:MAG: PilT/PilU family type 4a pilus ATPase [Polyangiales bacterium]
MLASKLFPLLARPEVQEIVLLGGKPPCALVNGTYRRLSSQILRDEDILSVVVAARGQEQLPNLSHGAMWEFQLPSVGRIMVNAGYEAQVLRMTLRIAQSRSVRDMPAVGAAPGAAQGGGWEQPSTGRSAQNMPAAAARLAAAERVANERALVEAPERPAARSGQLGAAAFAGPGPELDLPLAPEPPRARAAAPAADGDLLDTMLGRARQLRASDVHLLADRAPMLRIAGDLVPQPEAAPAALLERVIMERVPAAQLPILERLGACDFSLIHPRHGRFRANVSRQRSGIKLTARPIGQTVPTLAQLGLPESIANALENHQGLIVITGPTGHGKTTTLAALVGILNRETTHHVITVEDPIEYVHETARAVISQREVGSHTKTFAAALKGALREDPDVIVVGELRDTETVRMALSASETGHLVISTMNTPSAAKAIERLIDLFPPGDQPQVRMTLAGGLRLIISQRLVPTADRKQLCAAAEVLPGSMPLWNLIRENRTYQIASLQQRGKSIGIIRLDDSLAELVKTQRTSMEIAREYAESVDLLETMVKGKPSPQQGAAAQAADPADDNAIHKRGVELGKQVMSRAGKLFGGETK